MKVNVGLEAEACSAGRILPVTLGLFEHTLVGRLLAHTSQQLLVQVFAEYTNGQYLRMTVV